MSRIQRINPDSLFNSQQYGFSQVVVATGQRVVYLSGQVAWDEKENLVGEGDVGEQARQSLRNIQHGLAATGGGMTDVVSLRIYLVQHDRANNAAISGALREFFSSDAQPATTWVSVQGLANPGFLVEIEAVAVLG